MKSLFTQLGYSATKGYIRLRRVTLEITLGYAVLHGATVHRVHRVT